MREPFLFLVFLFLSIGLKGQPGKKFISAGVGYAIPTGDFRKNAFALDGINLHLINFDYLISRHLGVCFSWHSSINPNDNKALEQKFAIPDLPGIPDIAIESGNWYSGRFLAGPVFTKSKGNLDFQVNLTGGIAYLFAPEIQVKLNLPNMPDLATMEIRAEESNALAWGIAFLVRYTTRSRFSYYLSADYSRSNHQINYLLTYSGYEEKRGFDIIAETISVNAGLGYRIK